MNTEDHKMPSIRVFRIIKKLLRKNSTLSKYTLSLFYLNLSRLISGFFIYQWISPYHMGIWQTMILIQTYFGFAKLGVVNGMNRELPFYLGKGQKDKGMSLVNNTLFYNLFIIGTLLLVLLFGNKYFVKKDFFLPVLTIFIVISAQTYSTFLQGVYRSYLRFDIITKAFFIEGTLRLASIILIYFYNFKGFLGREIIVVIIMAILLHLFSPIKLKPVFQKKIFLILVKTGFPIFLFSYLIQVADTIPRFLILKNMDITSLGLFAPAATILGVLLIIPNSLSSFFYPKLTHNLGKSNSIARLFKAVIKVHFGISLVLLPVIVTAWFVLPIIIEEYIPKYIGSIEIIHLILISSLFLGFKFGYTSLVIIKAKKFMFLFSVIYSFFQFAFPMFLYSYFKNINGLVGGMILSYMAMFISSILLNFLAFKELKNKRFD